MCDVVFANSWFSKNELDTFAFGCDYIVALVCGQNEHFFGTGQIGQIHKALTDQELERLHTTRSAFTFDQFWSAVLPIPITTTNSIESVVTTDRYFVESRQIAVITLLFDSLLTQHLFVQTGGRLQEFCSLLTTIQKILNRFKHWYKTYSLFWALYCRDRWYDLTSVPIQVPILLDEEEFHIFWKNL